MPAPPASVPLAHTVYAHSSPAAGVKQYCARASPPLVVAAPKAPPGGAFGVACGNGNGAVAPPSRAKPIAPVPPDTHRSTQICSPTWASRTLPAAVTPVPHHASCARAPVGADRKNRGSALQRTARTNELREGAHDDPRWCRGGAGRGGDPRSGPPPLVRRLGRSPPGRGREARTQRRPERGRRGRPRPGDPATAAARRRPPRLPSGFRGGTGRSHAGGRPPGPPAPAPPPPGRTPSIPRWPGLRRGLAVAGGGGGAGAGAGRDPRPPRAPPPAGRRPRPARPPAACPRAARGRGGPGAPPVCCAPRGVWRGPTHRRARRPPARPAAGPALASPRAAHSRALRSPPGGALAAPPPRRPPSGDQPCAPPAARRSGEEAEGGGRAGASAARPGGGGPECTASGGASGDVIHLRPGLPPDLRPRAPPSPRLFLPPESLHRS